MNALSLEIFVDRPGETLVAYVVRRKGRDRAIASGKLMFSLSASLDAGECARNREFDRLIIADLEMQEGVLLDGPPIAPVERVPPEKINGARDIAAVALGHDEENMIAHRSAHMRKKSAVEIGRPPFARACIHIETKKYVPMGFGDAGTGQKLDRDATGERRLAFAADHLSLSRREIGQKGVEIRVTLVDEMKLLPGALQEPDGAERLPFRACGKSDMERRGSGFLAKCAKPGNERMPRCFAVPWRDE